MSRRGERERNRKRARRRQKKNTRGASRRRARRHRFSLPSDFFVFFFPHFLLTYKTKQPTPGRATSSAPSSWPRTSPTPSRYARARQRYNEREREREFFHRRRFSFSFPPLLTFFSLPRPPPTRQQERNSRHPDGGPGASRLSANARRGLGTLGAAIDGLRAAAADDTSSSSPSSKPQGQQQQIITEAERHRRLDAVAALRARREALLLQLRRPPSNSSGASPSSSSLSQPAPNRAGVSQQQGQQHYNSRPRETAETAPLDSVALLDVQRRTMERQDRELEGLERTVQSTKHVALAVGEELELQAGLLEDLDDDVGATGARLRAAGRQLAAVARRPGECRSLCTGLLALFVAAVVAILVIRIVRLL